MFSLKHRRNRQRAFSHVRTSHRLVAVLVLSLLVKGPISEAITSNALRALAVERWSKEILRTNKLPVAIDERSMALN